MTLLRLITGTCLLLAFGPSHAAGVDSFFAATLENPAGQTVALESFRGKPLVVNFVSRACESCAADTGELARQRQANGKLAVVTILVEENPEGQSEYIKSLGVSHPVLISGNRKGVWLMQNLGNPRGKPPFVVAIDKSGKLVSSVPQALSPATASRTTEDALR